MITVTWGSKKHHFKDIEELRAKYPTLNNRPDHIAPKVKKEYKRFELNPSNSKVEKAVL